MVTEFFFFFFWHFVLGAADTVFIETHPLLSEQIYPFLDGQVAWWGRDFQKDELKLEQEIAVPSLELLWLELSLQLPYLVGSKHKLEEKCHWLALQVKPEWFSSSESCLYFFGLLLPARWTAKTLKHDIKMDQAQAAKNWPDNAISKSLVLDSRERICIARQADPLSNCAV